MVPDPGLNEHTPTWPDAPPRSPSGNDEGSGPNPGQGVYPGPGWSPAQGAYPAQGGYPPAGGYPAPQPLPDPWGGAQPGSPGYGYGPDAIAAPPSKPSALPVVPREYHEFFRAPRFRWWKPLAALAMFTVAAVLLILLFSLLIAFDIASGRITMGMLNSGELPTTPILFLVNNLGLALWVALAPLTAWAVFGQRPKWLSSIAGGFRWRLFGRFALIAFVVLAVTKGILAVLSGGFEGLAWNSDSLFLIVTIVVTTPFQAAGEEYAMRGLGARAIGSWFSSRRAGLVVATVATSAVFMLMHGAGDPWLNAFYLLFAVEGSVLVWRTGGLEASVALHMCNNLISEAVLPFSSLEGLFDRHAGVAGPETLWQMAAVVGVGALMLWQAKRLKLSRTAAPAAPTLPEPSASSGVFWNSSHTIG